MFQELGTTDERDYCEFPAIRALEKYILSIIFKLLYVISTLIQMIIFSYPYPRKNNT